MAVFLLVAVALAASLGEAPLDLRRALFEPGSGDRLILRELRLPRVALAALVGAALALSGSALQALLRNPLADPFVLGVSGGAALGGTLSLALGGAALGGLLQRPCASLPDALGSACSAVATQSPTTLAALLGALAATAVVYGAGRFGGRLSPLGALLAGVVFNALASAAITFIKALSPPERIGELVYWLAGSLDYPAPSTLLALAAFSLLAFIAICARAQALNLLALGDEGASSLGLDVARVRRGLFLAISLLVAAAVSVSGMIGFVGLIAPHVLRLWLGPDQRLLLPASALGGAGFLVLADLLSRMLFTPLGTATPVGALTALLGGPVFLWMLRREKGRALTL